jgi:hypothetical protein
MFIRVAGIGILIDLMHEDEFKSLSKYETHLPP